MRSLIASRVAQFVLKIVQHFLPMSLRGPHARGPHSRLVGVSREQAEKSPPARKRDARGKPLTKSLTHPVKPIDSISPVSLQIAAFPTSVQLMI